MAETSKAEKTLLAVSPGRDVLGMVPHLEKRGWTVERCPGLLRAMVRLERGSFDAVLIDWRNVSDAEDEFREIRSVAPGLTVVVVSDSPGWNEGVDARVVAPDELPSLDAMVEAAYSDRWDKIKAKNLARMSHQARERVGRVADYAEQVTEATRRWREALLRKQDLYRSVVDTFRDLSGARRVSLMLREGENGEWFRVVCGRGLPERVIGEARIRGGESIAGRVANRGVSLTQKPPGVESRASRYYDFRSDRFLCLPLRTENEVRGVLSLSEPREEQALTGKKKEFLEALAEDAAEWLKLSRRLQRIRRRAMVDDLTGVYNRRYLREELDKEVQRAKRSARGFAVAMADIDHLKRYNDTFGHSAGDEVLQEVARLMQDNLRKTDTICRYGGDEFAVLLPDTGQEPDLTRRRATRAMERVRRVVDQHVFGTETTEMGDWVTLSAGVALLRGDAEDGEGLLREADRQLYRAKQAGWNRVRSASQ